MRNQKKLLLEQLDQKLMPFLVAGEVHVPHKGWIFAIRNTLNMTLDQLGRRLGKTRQGVKRIENSEMSGTISIKLLQEVGQAMDMRLVYGFIPNQGTLSKLVEVKSLELAEKIIKRTDQTMLLENQSAEKEHLSKAVLDLAAEISREMKRSLWD